MGKDFAKFPGWPTMVDPSRTNYQGKIENKIMLLENIEIQL